MVLLVDWAIEYLNLFNIKLVTFPDHTTHIFQPFDVCVAKSLKSNINRISYSPDLAICDFGLFGAMKISLAKKEFEYDNDLIQAVDNFFKTKMKTSQVSF